MSELFEPVAIGIITSTDTEEDQNKISCEWKNCKVNHTKKPEYPKNGNTERNSSYNEDWVKAGLEPWEKYGSGTDSQATLNDYKDETPNASYTKPAASLTYPAYHTQKHHLISVKLFKNVKDLDHDAKLIGYDVNHKKNGICLPSYVVDIVQHDLQCHRGNHPNDFYYVNIVPLLAEAEKRCIKYCHSDISGRVENQKNLINDLNNISQRVESKIKNWKWLLRSEATNERKESRYQLANRGR